MNFFMFDRLVQFTGMSKLQTVIFLIRHGDTDRPYSSNPQIDNQRVLTEEGREQLKKVGEYLKGFDPAAIFYSPRRRTLECATILKKTIANGCPMVEKSELLEIYNQEQYVAIDKKMPKFLAELVGEYAGKQVVCVSHQDTIQGAVSSLGVTSGEANFPCQTAQGYRLVFAGETFAEIQKIQPAHEI